MRKVIRGIGVGSVGKIAGLLYAAIGLLVGIIVAGISMLGGFAALAQSEAAGVIGIFFGVGAIIMFPIFYAVIGALIWMLVAVLYNVLARSIGGLELEVD